MKSTISEQTQLYRHYGADGSLLYVGISLRVAQRLYEHMKSSRWAAEIANIKIEHFDSRSLALQAEEAAIKNEKRIWNVIHNREVDAKKAEYVDIKASVANSSTKKQSLSDEHQWLSNNYNSLSCLVKMLGQLQVIADPLTLVTMGHAVCEPEWFCRQTL